MAMELSGDHPSQRTGVNSSSRTPDAPSISSKSPPNFQEEYIPPEGFSAIGSIDIGGQLYTASQEKPPSMHQLLQIKEANDRDRAERIREEQEQEEHASGWQKLLQLAKRPVLALGVLALLTSCIPAPGAHGSQHILPTGTHLTPDIGAHLSPIPVIPSYTPGIPPHISGELDEGQHISAISTPVPGEKNPPPPWPPTFGAPKDSGSEKGASPTPGIEATATPTPGIEATATPVPSETMIPAPSETPTPEATATKTAIPTKTVKPTNTKVPTKTPTAGPTAEGPWCNNEKGAIEYHEKVVKWIELGLNPVDQSKSYGYVSQHYRWDPDGYIVCNAMISSNKQVEDGAKQYGLSPQATYDCKKMMIEPYTEENFHSNEKYWYFPITNTVFVIYFDGASQKCIEEKIDFPEDLRQMDLKTKDSTS